MNLVYAGLLYLTSLAMVIFLNKYLFPDKTFQRKYIISFVVSVLYYIILNYSYKLFENEYLIGNYEKYIKLTCFLTYLLSNGFLGLLIRKIINKKKRVKEIAL